MPKTIEELEAEIVELNNTHKATIEKNEGLYKGQLAAKQEQVDTAVAHATDLATKNKTFEDEAEAKRKAIRKDNEAKAHAIDKDMDLSEESDLALASFLKGYEKAKAIPHSTQAPPAGSGTPTPPPATAAERLLQR